MPNTGNPNEPSNNASGHSAPPQSITGPRPSPPPPIQPTPTTTTGSAPPPALSATSPTLSPSLLHSPLNPHPHHLTSLDRLRSITPSPAPSIPPTSDDFAIPQLGPANIPTPVDFVHVVTDDDRLWLDPNVNSTTQATILKAGPRSHIYWDPETVKVWYATRRYSPSLRAKISLVGCLWLGADRSEWSLAAVSARL